MLFKQIDSVFASTPDAEAVAQVWIAGRRSDGIRSKAETGVQAEAIVTARIGELMRFAPLLLVPSGCAALIYQVTWVRLLGLSMGSTSAAVSTILTAFFLGLAIGSFFAGRFSRGGRAGLDQFLLLETIIGVTGFLLLPVLLNLDHGMALLGEMGTSVFIKFVASLLMLSIPTICMGATYPVMAAALIDRQDDMGADVSRLYALNTAGAVLGALLAGFVLTPRFGLAGAVYVAVALNLGAVVIGLLLRRKFAASSDGAQTHPATRSQLPAETHDSLHMRVALVLFGTGFVAIACEVAWTKYLAIFIGATIYGFAAILGVFLIGIALGSWAIKAYLQRQSGDRVALVWGLLALAVSLLLARVGLTYLPGVLDVLRGMEQPAQLIRGLKVLAIFVVLFPATFVFGALFPVSLSMYCRSVTDLNGRIGKGYAINTIGAILGAVAAGFWIIPAFGTDAVLSATIVIALSLSLIFIDVRSRQRQETAALALTVAVVIASWQLPHLDYARLIMSQPYWYDADAQDGKTPSVMFLEEGKAGVISVITYDGQKARLQNNGIQESYVGLDDTVRPPFTEVLLGLMPYLLHPDPTNAFLIGFGGGNTAQAMAETTLQEIRIVELEPAVIAAVASIWGGEIPVLKDARVELRLNDARNALLVENRSYDLIVSQPSHPWLAGAGNLFTRQFFEVASGKLNDGGIFAQWVNLFNMDATTLRSILQAYYEVFPHGFTLSNTDSGDLLLFGSHEKLRFDYERMSRTMRTPGIRQALATAKITRPAHLLWYFSMSRAEALSAAANVAPNTDTRIYSEVRLAGITVETSDEEDPYKLLAQHTSLDVLPYLSTGEAAHMVYVAGRYFYRHGAITRTRQAIAALENIDPAVAERLRNDWAGWRESIRQRTNQPVSRQN